MGNGTNSYSKNRSAYTYTRVVKKVIQWAIPGHTYTTHVVKEVIEWIIIIIIGMVNNNYINNRSEIHLHPCSKRGKARLVGKTYTYTNVVTPIISPQTKRMHTRAVVR